MKVFAKSVLFSELIIPLEVDVAQKPHRHRSRTFHPMSPYTPSSLHTRNRSYTIFEFRHHFFFCKQPKPLINLRWSEVCIIPLLQPPMCVKQRVLLYSSSECDNTAAIIGGVVAVVTAALNVVVVVVLLLRS